MGGAWAQPRDFRICPLLSVLPPLRDWPVLSTLSHLGFLHLHTPHSCFLFGSGADFTNPRLCVSTPSHQALFASPFPPTHPSSHPGSAPFLTMYSSCSHEPNPCPPFGNTSPIALTFSHRVKQRLTSPEINSHRAERHGPCPAPHARAQARRLLWREAHRRGVCQCTHINIHTHSLCAVPQKGADTRCARQGHTHLRAPRSPPSPAHPPRLALGQEQGLLRARAPPRFLAANVSLLGLPGPWGKGLRNAAGATWGKKVGTACSLPGPVGEFPNRETICGEGRVASEPPVTSHGVPSPCHHRWAPGGLGAAELPIAQPPGRSARLAASVRRLDHAECTEGPLCPRRVAGRPRAAGLFLSYQCRNAAAAAAAAAAAGGRRRRGPWAVRAALKGPPPHSARVEV